MKLLKAFGLATVAAVIAMAFIGATSASADVCLVNETPCSEANQKLLLHFLSGKTEGEFKSGFVTVKCHVLLHIEVLKLEPGVLWLLVHLTFTLTECSGCTSVSVAVNNAEAMPTGSGNGVLKGNGEATFKGCPFGVECKYKGENTESVLDGSATNALGLVINQSLPKSGGSGLCSSSGVWNATFHGVSAEDKMTWFV